MENGWIKIHRNISEKGWWSKSEYAHLWIHLLILANHSRAEFFHNGKIIKLDPGQFITGRKKLSIQTGISESKIERVLKCFENEQQIEQQTNSQNRVITIKNWKHYQQSEQQIGQPVDSRWTAGGHKQECNNNKKNKNIINTDSQKKDSETFDFFWKMYPNKKAKKTAEKVWGKLKIDETLYRKIIGSLQKQMDSPQWQKSNGQFIPHPSTWLNQERWNDEEVNPIEIELNF